MFIVFKQQPIWLNKKIELFIWICFRFDLNLFLSFENLKHFQQTKSQGLFVYAFYAFLINFLTLF